MPTPYEDLLGRLRQAATLRSVAELLGWDQETTMPPRAAAFRAEELALISRLSHRHYTDPRLGELIERCEADAELTADPAAAANLREIRRDFRRATKLPEDLVAEISETGSLAMEAWKQARADADFATFRPWLEKQLRLHRRKAECWGAPAGGDLYDALLDDYEPGMRGAELGRHFGPLRAATVELLGELRESAHRPGDAPHRVRIPVERQRAFHLVVLERLGFDLGAGRLDVSTHPFSSGLGPGDTRITTRYPERGFLDALGSTMHEAGHALYEQGLPKAERHGQPLAEPLSLGMHESQSRLWENQVGRSRAFWEWALPEARRTLGPELERFGAEELHQAANVVRPRLIRVESDEVTYNLHVLLRFDLERALVLGELAPGELPGAWNERVRDDLGLEVPDDASGCLQDIHWSMGAFGYFPTYTLGNLYAAQLWSAFEREQSGGEAAIRDGRFRVVLDWLRVSVHAHGRRFPAAELCRRATGSPLSHEPLVRYLRTKFRSVYRLDGEGGG